MQTHYALFARFTAASGGADGHGIFLRGGVFSERRRKFFKGAKGIGKLRVHLIRKLLIVCVSGFVSHLYDVNPNFLIFNESLWRIIRFSAETQDTGLLTGQRCR